MTGIRRSELLGLHWTGLGIDSSRLSINRGLVSVEYKLHESRGKTKNARRTIDLDPSTLQVLQGWRAIQAAEATVTGGETT